MRIPRDFPIFGALALSVGFLAFGFAGMYTESSIGRPSSTAALGYIFIPIYSLALAGLGFGVGVLVRNVWARHITTAHEKTIALWVLPAVLLAVVGGAAALGAWTVVESEAQSSAAVIVDTGAITREFTSNTDSGVRSSTKIYDSDEAPKSISWGQQTPQLRVEGDHVRIQDSRSSKRGAISTSGLNYVTRIDASTLRLGESRDEVLVIVISGRATGRRAIVAVLSSNYDVLFEERLERFWELSDAPIEVRMDTIGNREIAIIGPRCTRSLVIRGRSAV